MLHESALVICLYLRCLSSYYQKQSYLVILNLIVLTIFGEEHTLLSSSSCKYLYPYLTFSLIGPSISLNIHFPTPLLFLVYHKKSSFTPVGTSKHSQGVV